MKNVHLLPTDRPNRLVKLKMFGKDKLHLCKVVLPIENEEQYQHIYITSDEEIKEGDYIFETDSGYVNIAGENYYKNSTDFKIILTTDPDLIGVQSIDDEFLEWFVKNPSCESVEIENKKVLVGWEPDYTYEDLGIDGSKNVYHNFYKIIIPQEEPKQETLEEAAEKLYLSHENNELLYGHSEDLQLAYKAGILDGAKWQAERMYSEEGVLKILRQFNKDKPKLIFGVEEWFEQFKKK